MTHEIIVFSSSRSSFLLKLL